jgi:dephospho-CoA kinase
MDRLSGGKRQLSSEQVMLAFGDRAYLLLERNGIPLGMAGWQVENLVARIDDVDIDKDLPQDLALSMLLKEAELASQALQCEIALLFLPPRFKFLVDYCISLGYSSQPVQGLGVQAWEEAARDTSSTDAFVLYKQLRTDRIIRPV